MSTRTFCDNCGEPVDESTNKALKPLTDSYGGVCVKIEAGYNELGKGDVCADCVIDTVKRLDRRPQPARV